jgi:hypothetical protein
LSLVFSRRKPFQGGISMPKRRIPPAKEGEVELLVCGKYRLLYIPNSDEMYVLVLEMDGRSIRPKFSDFASWTKGASNQSIARFERLTRKQEDLENLLVTTALAVYNGRRKVFVLGSSVPPNLLPIVQSALEKINKIGE